MQTLCDNSEASGVTIYTVRIDTGGGLMPLDFPPLFAVAGVGRQ